MHAFFQMHRNSDEWLISPSSCVLSFCWGMFAVAVYTAPIGSHSSLLAWVRGSVIRQALASCGAPGSSNITPLSKLSTGLWRHCIVVQARAEQGSCLQKKDHKSYGLAYRKIPAPLCRLLLRDTGRTLLCFSDIPSSSKTYKNIQATLKFLNIIALKNSCLHTNAFLQQFCFMINFTWRCQTSNETFHSFIQCLLWKYILPPQEKSKAFGNDTQDRWQTNAVGKTVHGL